jgi:serine/threonine protein kinase
MPIRLQRDAKLYPGEFFEFDPGLASSEIGRGGMGIVYRGRLVHEGSGRSMPVAIKVLRPDLSPETIERAKREAGIKIVHENLLLMYGYISNDDTPPYHVISEYLDGEPLKNVLKKGRLSQSEALEIVKSVLSGLAKLHEKGYVHRDIDPSNIMVNPQGMVKLIDFGIAKKLGDISTSDTPNMTIQGNFIGKVNYASPEQIRGEHNKINESSDIYSVGIMLYELLTGKLPFSGNTFSLISAHTKAPIPKEEFLKIVIPESRYSAKALIYIIKKATHKEQARRYRTASEFIVDIERVEKGLPVGGKRNGLGKAIVAAAVILLAGLFAGGFFWHNHQKRKYSEYAEKAESGLSIGSYQSALDLYLKANEVWFKPDSVKNKIEMLSTLVRGVREYTASNYLEAESLFKEAMLLNSSDAYFYLGEMYYEGLGVPKNYDKGYELTTKAFRMGNAFAEYRLGLIYKNGIGGIKPDINKALEYFDNAGKVIDKAASDNNPNLQYLKGNMYLSGSGGYQQNKKIAMDYFEKAAAQGNAQAEYALYECLAEEDYNTAMGWLEKSAKHNYPKAQNRLGGVCYAEGRYQEALLWTEKAAAKNFAPALARMGAFYEYTKNREGIQQTMGLEGNDVISHQYTQKAVDYDFEYAKGLRDLAYNYRHGIGVVKDIPKADSLDNRADEKELTINRH